MAAHTMTYLYEHLTKMYRRLQDVNLITATIEEVSEHKMTCLMIQKDLREYIETILDYEDSDNEMGKVVRFITTFNQMIDIHLEFN